MENLGRLVGQKTRSVARGACAYIIAFLRHFSIYAVNKVYALGVKKFTIIAIIIALLSCIVWVAYSEIKSYIAKKQTIIYYNIQPMIENSLSMSLSDIKMKILEPVSGILRANNAMKVARILAISDERFNDAISVLEYARSFSNQRSLNEILSMNILAIQINHKIDIRNIKDVEKIARSNSRFVVMAKELLATNDLSYGNLKAFYAQIDALQVSGDVRTPYMKSRIDELSYIAYQGGHIK